MISKHGLTPSVHHRLRTNLWCGQYSRGSGLYSRPAALPHCALSPPSLRVIATRVSADRFLGDREGRTRTPRHYATTLAVQFGVGWSTGTRNVCRCCVAIAHVLRHFLTAIASLLEVLPLAAVALMASAYWDRFPALFGVGTIAADFSLRSKAVPIPTNYVVTLLVVLVTLVGARYAEELVRCARARSRRVTDRQRAERVGR